MRRRKKRKLHFIPIRKRKRKFQEKKNVEWRERKTFFPLSSHFSSGGIFEVTFRYSKWQPKGNQLLLIFLWGHFWVALMAFLRVYDVQLRFIFGRLQFTRWKVPFKSLAEREREKKGKMSNDSVQWRVSESKLSLSPSFFPLNLDKEEEELRTSRIIMHFCVMRWCFLLFFLILSSEERN